MFTLLNQQHQRENQRDVYKGEAEEFPGGIAVCVAVKVPGQIGQVKVEGQGVQGEGPGGEVQGRRQGAQPDHSHAVA